MHRSRSGLGAFDDPSQGWDSIGAATIMYGVVMADPSQQSQVGIVTVPGSAQIAPALTHTERDAWWRWALKVGVVTAAVYGIYKLVTKGE